MPKTKSPRYYGLLTKIDLRELIDGVMGSNTPVPDTARAFWERLKHSKRYTARPHVTIVHGKEKDQKGELWDVCVTLAAGKPPLVKFSLTHLVWNENVMALAVDDLRLVNEKGRGEEGNTFLNALDDNLKTRLHITVGTREPSISPVQAKELIAQWRAGAETNTFLLDEVTAQGRVKGLFT